MLLCSSTYTQFWALILYIPPIDELQMWIIYAKYVSPFVHSQTATTRTMQWLTGNGSRGWPKLIRSDATHDFIMSSRDRGEHNKGLSTLVPTPRNSLCGSIYPMLLSTCNSKYPSRRFNNIVLRLLLDWSSSHSSLPDWRRVRSPIGTGQHFLR